MSEHYSPFNLTFTWQAYATDELEHWAVEYSPFMEFGETFQIQTPDGPVAIKELDTVRALHTMLGEAIKKAEDIELNERPAIGSQV